MLSVLSGMGQAGSPYFRADNTIASWPGTNLQRSLQGQHHIGKVEEALPEALHVEALKVEVLLVEALLVGALLVEV